MKAFVYVLAIISTVCAQDRSVCTGNPPYTSFGNILGDVFLGACSAAQKNMENTADPCYTAANEVK